MADDDRTAEPSPISMGLVSMTNNQVKWRSLVRQQDFQKMYTQGAKTVGRLVVVYLWAPETEADGTRETARIVRPDFARSVVASKKVGNAVARNRAKRLLREALRLGQLGNLNRLDDPEAATQLRAIRERFLREPANGTNTTEGLWVVLVARQRILGATSREVREELDTLLNHGPQPH